MKSITLTHDMFCYKVDSENRFWSKVEKGNVSECWNWLATPSHKKGQFRLGKRQYVSSRLAWIFTHGAIPDDLYVCHSCDNQRCCNPAHLFLGTHQDNMDDMKRKNRQSRLRGSEASNAKLTEAQVREIRNKYCYRKYTQPMLSKEYEVSRSTIEAIINRYNWKEII